MNHLWDLFLWWFKLILVEKVLSQYSQGRITPSKCWASMWSLILHKMPSLPQTLQSQDLFCPFPALIIFWPISIIDFTFSSRACRFVPNCSDIDNAIEEGFSKALAVGMGSFWLVDFKAKSLLFVIDSECWCFRASPWSHYLRFAWSGPSAWSLQQ